MKLGTDFFVIFQFVSELIKLLIRFFGDEDDAKKLLDDGDEDGKS